MLVIEAATSAAATAHCGGGGDDRCGDKGLTAAATLATAARRCSDNLCMRSAQGSTLVHSKVFISFTGKVFISQAKFSFHTTHSRPHPPGTDRGIGPANLRHTAQESACEHAGSCSTACR